MNHFLNDNNMNIRDLASPFEPIRGAAKGKVGKRRPDTKLEKNNAKKAK